MVEKQAKKISDIFADSRLDKKDLDYLALRTVLMTRDGAALDRIETFLERFLYHRYSIEFGVDNDDPYALRLEA